MALNPAEDIAENRTLDYALRALQLIFAIIVMGTDGYAIHVFRGQTVYVYSVYGNFYAYAGVPNAWGFLMFCAGWTFVIVLFHLIAGNRLVDRSIIAYIRVAAEVVAVLSWLAGFIAVAIQISNGTSSEERHSHALLTAATVFGACEWLLFMVTAALTVKLVFNRFRKPTTSTTRPNAVV